MATRHEPSSPTEEPLSDGTQLGLLTEAVRDYAIFTLDTEGRVASWNAAAQRIKGWRADEVIGRHFSIFYPPEDVAQGKPEAELRRAAAEGYAEDDGWRMRKDGSRFWANVEITSLRDPEGQLRGFGKITCDLTRRRHAEARFRQLVEGAPDALVISDRRGRIQLVNSQAERIFGWTRSELVGQPIETLVPPRFRGVHVGDRAKYANAPAVRPMGAGLDLLAVRKDGSEFPAEISLSPIEGDDGPLVIAAVRDVTARRTMERALREAKDNAEAANRELEAFSYSVSHDLRAPLRSIDGFSQALLEDYTARLDDAGQDYLRRVRTAAQRMAQLIDDLLQLSRVSRAALTSEPVDLSALARSVATELQKTRPDRSTEFVIAEGIATRGDARLLRLVFENLLGNAWKFTARVAAPRIEVGMTAQDGERVFYVRDNGAGFDMRYVDKLFRAFQRLHAVADFPGTGIGLATVQRIVRRHGGRVWAEASIDGGATFSFTLPGPAPAEPGATP